MLLSILRSQFTKCVRFVSLSSIVPKNVPRVLIPIANGTEELEAVMTFHILARAGAAITTAAVDTVEGQNCCIGKRGMKFVADEHIKDCVEDSWDMIVLPGGNDGADTFRQSPHLTHILNKQHLDAGWIGAICASPAMVLAPHMFLKRRTATCFPPMRNMLEEDNGVTYSDDKVVVDGHFVTSQGPSTALAFGCTLVEVLMGKEKADEIRKEFEI